MSDPTHQSETRKRSAEPHAGRPETGRIDRRRLRGSARAGLIASLLLVLCFSGPANAQPITDHGHQLIRMLDSMHVEDLWLSHEKVHWRTGRPTGEPLADRRPHTHCSTFVAATAERLNIYILRPPEHSAVMLANAQAQWLPRQGAEYGWRAVRTPEAAQQLANRGILVVAVYRAHTPVASGHIAIVRPSVKSYARIEEEGPQITQAGMENYASATLRRGFRHHKHAWERGKVRFFAHRVDWRQV